MSTTRTKGKKAKNGNSKVLGLKETYLAINDHMKVIDYLEKEVVKLTHNGSIQQLREKREELQWCRNSLTATELKFAELSKTLVTYMCEVGLVLYKGKIIWNFGFDKALEVTGRTPEEAVTLFMEKLG